MPAGAIEPLAPAVALMVSDPMALKLALMVWFAVTLLKVVLLDMSQVQTGYRVLSFLGLYPVPNLLELLVRDRLITPRTPFAASLGSSHAELQCATILSDMRQTNYRDLAEFALSLLVNLKVDDGTTKVLLQKSCERFWPDELRGRNKQGFGSPIQPWLKLKGVTDLIQDVFSPSSRLSRLLPGMASRRGGGVLEDWILLVLGLWLEKNGVRRQAPQHRSYVLPYILQLTVRA